MITEQQLKAWNEARLLKAAIKRNAMRIAKLLPPEVRAELVAMESKRETMAANARHAEYDVDDFIEGAIQRQVVVTNTMRAI